MRTKNAKRLWPVPIVAAVAVIGMLALLVATPTVPWGQAEVHAADRPISSPAAATGCKVNAAATNDASCTFRTEQGTLTLTNEVETDEANWAVYVTGGSDYDIQATDDRDDPADDGSNHLGKKGLGEHLVTIPKRDGFGRDGRVEIPLSRSMSDSDGNVYVFVYAPSETTGVPLSVETDPDDLPELSSGDVMVRVTFLVEPVRARDATRDDTVALDYTDDDDDVSGSTLLATVSGVARPTGSMGDADEDGYDDMMWVLGGTAGEVTITATIQDANGNDLDAGDKDSTVVFQIDYVEGSDIGASTLDYSERVVMMQDSNAAVIMVDGWNGPEGAPAKPVRVVITATYTGPTALNGFDVGTIVLTPRRRGYER